MTWKPDTPNHDMKSFPSGQKPSTAVIKTVAVREEIDTSNLPPLYEVIDPEALNAVCRINPVCVTFEYHGYAVTITGDNQIDLTESARD